MVKKTYVNKINNALGDIGGVKSKIAASLLDVICHWNGNDSVLECRLISLNVDRVYHEHRRYVLHLCVLR